MGCKSPAINCPIRMASISKSCGGNNTCSAWKEKPQLPGGHRATTVGAIWVASKSGGLNERGIPELPRKVHPHRSRRADRCGVPTHYPFVGKADVLREVTGKGTAGTAVVKGQTSGEGYAGITSGRATSQQGLAATCKDQPYKAKPKSEKREVVWHMGPYERRRRGNALRSGMEYCSRVGNAETGQRAPGRLAVAGDPPNADSDTVEPRRGD